MPRRTVDPVYVPFNPFANPGTQPQAPNVQAVAVPPGTLETIDVLIPAGHAGVTGIRFLLAGQQFLPWSSTDTWISGDDLRETFAVGIQVDTGLAVACYNLGAELHLWYLRFRVRQLTAGQAMPTVALIDPGLL